MSVATAVPLSEYLNTTYRPDCDYLEGELLERNVGEWDHSLLQIELAAALHALKRKLGIITVTEQRVQVKTRRFRIPDIAVLKRRPATGIVTEPPFLCVEILSPDDRMVEMRERVNDYLEFGVPYIWVIDPKSRLTTVYTADGMHEISNGILSTRDPDITVDLNALE
ncbi:MAG TPA: Uma2 family endonuclease [Bryobacteraceae bacterium]|nr:Uma2 family endonuclease [Bryobacteraceae bacterium]